MVVTHEHELARHFNKRVITIDHGTVVDDTAAEGDFIENAFDDDDDALSDPDALEEDAEEVEV